MAGDQLYQALGRGLWRGYTPRTGFPADTAWTMVRDRQQTLWVGTNRGVVVEAGDVWSTIRGTEAYTIEALADAGPVMYAAGTNGTVMAIDRASGATTVVGPSADLANNNMSSMLEIDGTLWVGTLNKGLLRMDGQTWRAEALPGGTTTEDIGQLLLDRAGRLWVAGNGGLAMRERGRWRRFTKADGLESTMVAYLVERASGEICVAYSQALGVTCFRYTNGLTQLSTINRAVGLTSDKLYLLGEDRHGRLYAGMGVGLDVIDGGVIEHFSTSSGMVGDDCAARAFLAEPTGEVLIGTHPWPREVRCRPLSRPADGARTARDLGGSRRRTDPPGAARTLTASGYDVPGRASGDADVPQPRTARTAASADAAGHRVADLVGR